MKYNALEFFFHCKQINNSMVNPNELRIGNWLGFYKPTIKEIQYLKIKEIFCIEQTEEGYFVGSDQYSPININKGVLPISITTDILYQCGFVKWGKAELKQMAISIKNNEWLVFDFEQLVTIINNRMGVILVIYNQPTHLHQLQNLYFSLTGQELKVNLNVETRI